MNDEAIGNDFLRVLTKLQLRIISLDLHMNPQLGRPAMYHLREFYEENKAIAFSELDLSDCPKCLKSAIVLEMRSRSGLKVIYTREKPKVKAKK